MHGERAFFHKNVFTSEFHGHLMTSGYSERNSIVEVQFCWTL